jgi:hypothetical protein
MKLLKKLSVLAVFIATMATAQAQVGQINFLTLQNLATVGPFVFDVNGTTKLETGFLAQLYVGTTTDTSTYVAIGTPQVFQTGVLAGVINAGNVDVTGTAVGDSRFYQVRAWNSAGGTVTSFSSATVRGSSSAQSVVLGNSTLTDPTKQPPSANLHSSFSLAVVPEPTSIVLGIIGGSALLFRRRKI